jgi:FixJ family two-component response regulator
MENDVISWFKNGFCFSKNRPIPIIFITARENSGTLTEAMRARAVDFLPKPFSEEALLKAIRRALVASF